MVFPKAAEEIFRKEKVSRGDRGIIKAQKKGTAVMARILGSAALYSHQRADKINLKSLSIIGRALGVLVLLSLTACLGGGGGGGGSSDPETGTANLAPKASFSDDDIRHLLKRTHFGIVQSEFDTAKSTGVSSYIDSMLTWPAVGSTTVETTAFQQLVNGSDPVGFEGKFPSKEDITQWILSLQMNTEHPFQEMMTLFWHDHFGVSVDVDDLDNGSTRHLFVDHYELLRAQGLGSFKTLVKNISEDPAMLYFLTGSENDKFDPNENYGREVLELFTHGVDNGYTQADIEESARALTGYEETFDSGTGLSSVQLDLPNNKNLGTKFILNTLIPNDPDTSDYDELHEILFDSTDADGRNIPAHFIVEKILRHFVEPNPPQAAIDELAQDLIANGWEIKPVLSKLFKSEYFYSEHEPLARTPNEALIGFARTTGMLVYSGSNVNLGEYRVASGEIDFIPSQPPGVQGWPYGVDLQSGQGMMFFANHIREVVIDRNDQKNAGFDFTDLNPAGASTADDVVDHWAALLDVQLTSAERTMLIDYMNTDVSNTIDPLTNEYEETPLNYTPANENHFDKKGRGVLYIMCQLPSFFTK